MGQQHHLVWRCCNTLARRDRLDATSTISLHDLPRSPKAEVEAFLIGLATSRNLDAVCGKNSPLYEITEPTASWA